MTAALVYSSLEDALLKRGGGFSLLLPSLLYDESLLKVLKSIGESSRVQSAINAHRGDICKREITWLIFTSILEMHTGKTCQAASAILLCTSLADSHCAIQARLPVRAENTHALYQKSQEFRSTPAKRYTVYEPHT